MALALPEILNKILNFLAKDNTLYPTLLVSKLWFMCASQILWRRIKLMGDDYGTMRLEKFIK
jgi:hypothetical protein